MSHLITSAKKNGSVVLAKQNSWLPPGNLCEFLICSDQLVLWKNSALSLKDTGSGAEQIRVWSKAADKG